MLSRDALSYDPIPLPDRCEISDADMLVAVTNSDETNIVACQVAHSLFHTPTKIARVRSHEYLKYKELFNKDHLPIDVLISPEQLISEHIQRLIEYPGALQVLDLLQVAELLPVPVRCS